ncbi:MAG: bifunctional diaminohydroxyphosphoribosylaminopyrimidine deaminase/5-amino-6-(5-phosphoribosylamino)uracil reductase RibD [Aquificota bacterium]|nr:MAG: bifunctional diaminohydroxyphosphoribosylaminopyrimidine deaminase/5-amino-6-(5-phosphoribosylamino)uracil reductase RibD [Aquificota bacterium]
MHLALELARLRKGLTHPNPTVGAVVVKEGRVVGQGYHERAGMPHAEVVALQQAGELVRGADLYVTLEPCTHYGRTPPCTDAIIRAGVKRVVIATLDPNPVVSGKGVEKLRSSGIEVRVGVLEEEAKRLNEDFFTYITQKRPYITLKLAQSIDGCIATKRGDSKWITSRESRDFAHRLRAEATAVLVGINTVLRDDPLLTIRAFPWERQPLRVVLDPELKIPMECNLVKDPSAKTLVFTSSEKEEKIKALEEVGVEVVLQKPLSLRGVLDELFAREVMHLLVEGGARTVSGFIKEGLYDRFFVFFAPILIGDGVKISDLGVELLSEAPRLCLRGVKVFGGDLAVEYVRCA